jgi:5-methylcytosine-specific restriction endonuclease McrA
VSKARNTWRRKQRGINITRLMARDGANCTICGEPLDRAIPVTSVSGRPDHPMAITFDHIVTRSAGGTDALSNLRLAHARCNWTRGNDPLVETEETT